MPNDSFLRATVPTVGSLLHMQPHPSCTTPPWSAASPTAAVSPGAGRRVPLAGKWLTLGLLACLITTARSAQSYQPVRPDPLLEPWRWRTFPELSGLDAHCMAEGPDGTIWFGTADGLTGYNGIEWTRHLSDNGALAGWVAGLCFERDGSLVAGGWWGISRLSGGKWTRLVPEVGVRFADVRDLVLAPDGSIWAATSWGALRRQESTWTLFTNSATAARLRADARHPSLRVEILPEAVLAKPRRDGSPASRIDLMDVALDARGRVWFGTKGGEILLHDPPAAPADAWHLYNETDGLASGRVTSILPHPDGTVWAAQGLAAAVSVFDGTAWQAQPLPPPGLAPDGGRLLQTRDGTVWLSARYVVYARDPGGAWRKYEPPVVPLPHATNLLLQSRDGALWFAGPNTDIQRIDYQTPRWQTLQDLNFQWESPAGAQWFLHRSGRVVVHDAGRWTSYGPEDGLIDAPVALLGARDGTVWAAGSHEHVAATARFDGRGWARTIHSRFSWGIDHRAVFESRDGSVWFGAAVDSSGPPEHRNGILQFRAGEWIHHHQPGRSPRSDGVENPATVLPTPRRPEPIEKFISFGESRGGKIWAGRNVIIFHDGRRWAEFTPATELRLSVIESMLTTREGDLWIGTRQYGALHYDGRRWKQFQGRDSLLANSVRSMAQTADGSIWVATDRGVSRFDGQAWTDNVLPAQLLIGHEGGNLKAAPSGSLWINRQTIDWNRRAWPKFTPPAAAGEFWTACYRPGGDPPRTVITSGPIQVSQPGNLSILWSGAAAWREPNDARLQFSFRLDDQPWSPYTSAGGQALFTLPHGPHRFSVRARDQDHNVDPTPATLEFMVLPPVWRQAWFIALMCVLGGLVAAQSVRVVRERARLRRSNARLASEIVARQQTEGALRNVLRHARTIVMHAEVTAPANWNRGDPRAVVGFDWNARFPDEAAAQEVLPLELASGEGYSAAWSRARHPADREPMTITAGRAFATGASGWQQEFRCIDRHGRLHWFDQTALLEAVGPDRWRVTTVSTDITGRKRAEEAHLTSEERLSTVFHLSPTPICIVHAADDRIVDVNEAFCEGTGYRHEELVGRTPDELNLWSDPAERAEIIRKLRDGGTAIACKLHGRRKSGGIGVGLGSVARIALNGEEHFLWLILDITEQERAEEARRESEGRFRQVTENIDEVFWLTDPAKQEMIYISPAYQRVWGRTCESLYAQPQSWLDAIHPEDRSRIREAVLALQGTGGYHHEYRILRPDGAVRWIRDRAFPIKDADGRVCRIAGVAEDITARHQLEDQLRQAQKMESLGTLAGGIAHDFNNILTGVLGSAELARLTLPADHKVTPWIENIASAGNRARALVQQILTFGRQHESEMVSRRLQPVVEEALRLLRTTIPAMVQIEGRIDPACPLVVADETQIHQVVMNLCTNAWHALGEEGGRIEVALEPAQVTPQMAAARLGLSAGPHVRLTVRDNGRGMTPEVLARIFEPFFTTKKPGHGTGLGLAVVHGIVQGHHGAIYAQSTPGAGTQFEIFLPTVTIPQAHGPAQDDQAFERGASQEILLVDDDASALAGLRMQLEHLGYRVTAVSDPRMALLKFRSEKFDLVLTDYAMAEHSGQDLAARMLAAAPDTPILLASGLIGPQQVQRARAIGIREVLRKPIPLADLARAVAQHLNSK